MANRCRSGPLAGALRGVDFHPPDLQAMSAVGPASSVAWGVGLGQSASSSVGGQTSGPTLTAYQVFATKHSMAPSGLTCRSRLLPIPTLGRSVAETLQAIELRWVLSMQPSSRGTARLSSETSVS